MPILDVTPLGSTRSGTAAAVSRIVDYLTRPAPARAASVEGYFADRAERPGVWRGRGVEGEHLTGEVTPEHLSRLLLGGHLIHAGVPIAATGSAGRAAARRESSVLAADGRAMLGVTDAAAVLGLGRSYVKRLLLATERHDADPEHRPRPVQPLVSGTAMAAKTIRRQPRHPRRGDPAERATGRSCAATPPRPPRSRSRDRGRATPDPRAAAPATATPDAPAATPPLSRQAGSSDVNERSCPPSTSARLVPRRVPPRSSPCRPRS